MVLTSSSMVKRRANIAAAHTTPHVFPSVPSLSTANPPPRVPPNSLPDATPTRTGMAYRDTLCYRPESPQGTAHSRKSDRDTSRHIAMRSDTSCRASHARAARRAQPGARRNVLARTFCAISVLMGLAKRIVTPGPDLIS